MALTLLVQLFSSITLPSTSPSFTLTRLFFFSTTPSAHHPSFPLLPSTTPSFQHPFATHSLPHNSFLPTPIRQSFPPPTTNHSFLPTPIYDSFLPPTIAGSSDRSSLQQQPSNHTKFIPTWPQFQRH
ncbi:hypothetical protein Pcinc_032096 [Petrolisthes cinctipes]|uniref:Uncharacterized protein n=1 Tax=Petrolisthes cinctipes TaxID=88211 RepID=A0AAE1K3W5_PETCI|nr:hypothetical protein Pcinc_032096 [Petrolisthes cinctipes]